MSDLVGIREQIIANAKIMLATRNPSTFTANSSTTLMTSPGETAVVVFGQDKYIAAVMVGLTPAIESIECATPELAMRKLFTTVCEVLALHIPKLGIHQRAVHGGGCFDDDLIVESLKKN
nr:hypothetical protein B0A51_09079 [Rachicladosporium sp. CCFEE 5018]